MVYKPFLELSICMGLRKVCGWQRFGWVAVLGEPGPLGVVPLVVVVVWREVGEGVVLLGSVCSAWERREWTGEALMSSCFESAWCLLVLVVVPMPVMELMVLELVQGRQDLAVCWVHKMVIFLWVALSEEMGCGGTVLVLRRRFFCGVNGMPWTLSFSCGLASLACRSVI